MCSGSISSGAVTHARSGTLTMRDKSAIMQKQQLTKEFHKPIITRFKKNRKYTHLLKTILIFIVNIVVPLKYEKSVTITNTFQ